MPPIADSTYEAAVPRPVPFKNPKWKTPYRRHKPMRQLLSEEQKRILSINASSASPSPSPTPSSLSASPIVDGKTKKIGRFGKAAKIGKGGRIGKNAKPAAIPVKIVKTAIKPKKKGVLPNSADLNRVTYFSLDAYPSLKPRKHYCDITGLKGNYKTPTNGLRYFNIEVYNGVIKSMTSGVDQQYLELRNANVILK